MINDHLLENLNFLNWWKRVTANQILCNKKCGGEVGEEIEKWAEWET